MGAIGIRQVVLFLAVGAASLAAGYFFGQWRSEEAVRGDGAETLVAFALPDAGGVPRHVDEWRGKALLLNFWATWCAPCREEIPELTGVQASLADRGLQVVGIAVDRPEAVRQFMEEVRFNYPSLVGESEGLDIMAAYGNPGSLPFTLAFDRDGNLVGRKLGKISAGEIRDFVERMLPDN